jgi:hypothetical protein
VRRRGGVDFVHAGAKEEIASAGDGDGLVVANACAQDVGEAGCIDIDRRGEGDGVDDGAVVAVDDGDELEGVVICRMVCALGGRFSATTGAGIWRLENIVFCLEWDDPGPETVD